MREKGTTNVLEHIRISFRQGNHSYCRAEKHKTPLRVKNNEIKTHFSEQCVKIAVDWQSDFPFETVQRYGIYQWPFSFYMCISGRNMTVVTFSESLS